MADAEVGDVTNDLQNVPDQAAVEGPEAGEQDAAVAVEDGEGVLLGEDGQPVAGDAANTPQALNRGAWAEQSRNHNNLVAQVALVTAELDALKLLNETLTNRVETERLLESDRLAQYKVAQQMTNTEFHDELEAQRRKQTTMKITQSALAGEEKAARVASLAASKRCESKADFDKQDLLAKLAELQTGVPGLELVEALKQSLMIQQTSSPGGSVKYVKQEPGLIENALPPKRKGPTLAECRAAMKEIITLSSSSEDDVSPEESRKARVKKPKVESREPSPESLKMLRRMSTFAVFDGALHSSFDRWVQNFEMDCLRARVSSEDCKIVFLEKALQGEAAKSYAKISTRKRQTYRSIIMELRERFTGSHRSAAARNEFAVTPFTNEGAQVFVDMLSGLALVGWPDEVNPGTGDVVQSLKTGRRAEVRARLLAEIPEAVRYKLSDELYSLRLSDLSRRIDATMRIVLRFSDPVGEPKDEVNTVRDQAAPLRPMRKPLVAPTSQPDNTERRVPADGVVPTRRDRRERKKGNPTDSANYLERPQGVPSYRDAARGENRGEADQGRAPRSTACFKCQEEGHFARECPRKDLPSTGPNAANKENRPPQRRREWVKDGNRNPAKPATEPRDRYREENAEKKRKRGLRNADSPKPEGGRTVAEVKHAERITVFSDYSSSDDEGGAVSRTSLFGYDPLN
jgi:hypothetical protein